MTEEQFRSQINGKIFVELQGEAISSFTSLTPPEQGGEGYAIREAATEAGVIVFLTQLHKIFAKGTYYGCDPDAFDTAVTNITNLQNGLQTLSGLVGDLNNIVTAQGEDISDIQDWTTEKAETIAQHSSDIADIISEIEDIQNYLNINPDSGSSTAIVDVIDGRLFTLLGFDKKDVNADPEDTIFTWDDTTQGGTFTQIVKNLQTAVSNLNTSLEAKADLLDFNTLATKLGSDAWPWSNDPEEAENNETIVSVINGHTSSIQTLRTTISGIPHFNIVVLESENDLPVDSIEHPISRSTIYLVKQANQQNQEGEGSDSSQTNNRELFTEYIWVNRNAYDDQLTPDWGWERLGSQFFNIESYVDQETLDGIKDDLEAQIEAITSQFNSSLIGRIESAENSISSLGTQYTNLSTELHSLIQNGVFKLTGEDIKTSSAQGSNTIYQDIVALKNGKLDNTTLEWAIIGDTQEENE